MHRGVDTSETQSAGVAYRFPLETPLVDSIQVYPESSTSFIILLLIGDICTHTRRKINTSTPGNDPLSWPSSCATTHSLVVDPCWRLTFDATTSRVIRQLSVSSSKDLTPPHPPFGGGTIRCLVHCLIHCLEPEATKRGCWGATTGERLGGTPAIRATEKRETRISTRGNPPYTHSDPSSASWTDPSSSSFFLLFLRISSSAP
jgi:hypothetical protein